MFLVFILFILLIVVLFSLVYYSFIYLLLYLLEGFNLSCNCCTMSLGAYLTIKLTGLGRHGHGCCYLHRATCDLGIGDENVRLQNDLVSSPILFPKVQLREN